MQEVEESFSYTTLFLLRINLFNLFNGTSKKVYNKAPIRIPKMKLIIEKNKILSKLSSILVFIVYNILVPLI